MVSKEDARKEVKRLVDLYEKYKASGDIKNFEGKEQNTKTTFILPLFKALGWDVNNEKNIEVVSEERVLKGAVDYAFRISGQNKFFVEAKPIGSELKSHAKQAIEYGVNSGNAWVVLTSFESIIIFNCEWKEKDWWKNALFGQLDYKDYLNNFDMLWLLSKESTISGGLDEWATRVGKKVPRTPIDKELLSKFLEWRLKLSKDLSKKYSTEEIDELVQRLLTRLLFIKNCEDRDFESNYRLSSALEAYKVHKKGLLKMLRRIFDYYESIYDSGIFEKGEVDEISFDEDLLSEILNGLHFTPDGLRYNFNVIPADVMGNLYEQYLGHILKKTPQRAKLNDGRAYRKEQGIYYTPAYIVDYIVRNTLGELLKGKKVDASKIKVLDPACGSGSFLVKAFDVLNEHYAKDKMYGQKTLTGYSTKERILKDNIFGVDLDKQAAEIAQLNLLLRIAEKGQKLPLLQQNVKIGNSLIDDEKIAGNKAFKWEEQFKDIIKEGGFDVVIGNPPYFNIRTNLHLQNFCRGRYPEIFNGQNDVLFYFVLIGLNLLKEGGKLGFIVSRYFLESDSAKRFREFILNNSEIIEIIDFGNNQVFEGANVLTALLILRKTKKPKNNKIIITKFKDDQRPQLISELDKEANGLEQIKINQNELTTEIWTFYNPEIAKVIRKIEIDCINLGQIAKTGAGIQSGLNDVFVVNKETIEKYKIENAVLRNYIKTRDIKPYRIINRNLFVIRLTNEDNINKFPNTKKYLLEHENALKNRYESKKNICKWYSFAVARNLDIFDSNKEKIITPIYSTSNKFCFDSGQKSENYLTLSDTAVIQVKTNYPTKAILGILNSKMMNFYYKKTRKLKREGYYEYLSKTLETLPIKPITESQQQLLIKVVDKMIILNKNLNEFGDRITDGRAKLEEEIKKISTEIDELVYKIYCITEQEKKIINESLK